MSQVVTELVIDANTSGADTFSQAMDRASDSAQKAVSGAGSVALAIAGVGVATIGAIAGLRAFVDYAGQQSQVLVDIADHAAIAGVSTKEFQQILFAARSQGVSDKDFVTGFDKIAADLAQAGQGVTQFSQLFEANGIAIKNQNGQLITTKAALADIMQLMQNAAPAVQQQIAKIVGLSADWIPFLKEGAAQFETQKQAAENLGVIIEDSTIAKAAEFNAQWKTAVATWDLQFKASIGSILPLLTQLASLASSILSGVGAVSGFGGRLLTPDDDKTKSQLNDQINDAYRLREAVSSLGDIKVDSFAGFKARTLAGTLGLPEDANLQQIDGLIDKLGALYDKKPTQLTVNPLGTTVLPPSGGGGKDAIDTTTDAIERQIAKMQADAEAAGQGAQALEQLRVEAQLYAAAERSGKTDLEQYADRFYNLSQRAGEAAAALAKAKVAAEIKFGANTAFLSSDDVAIATKLKDIYPNVTQALSSAEAAQLRFNSAAKGFSNQIENDLVGGLTDIATGTKSVGQGFSDLAATVLKSIEQMIIKIAIVQPMMAALQASVSSSGILGFLGIGASSAALPGSGSFIGPVLSAHGNAFELGQVVPFAQGGVVDSPTLAPMALFGEAGPEAIVPLKRGADGNLGIASSAGGGAPQLVFTYAPSIDARGADAAAVGRIASVVAQDKRDFERNVQAVMARARRNNPGAV